MARLVISEQINLEELSNLEKEIFEFVKRDLPDYIYAFYDVQVKNRYELLDIDLMLLVPHMGVYVIKILGSDSIRDENGKINKEFSGFSPDENKNRMNRKGVKAYLKKRFNIEPLVYDMMWLPDVTIEEGKAMIAENNYFPEKIIYQDDMKNYTRFLMKLQRNKVFMYEFYPPVWGLKYDDLTDTMAHNIFFYWETGMPVPSRPEKPPVVFLSYNQLNQVLAGEIKAELENRGIFVWRAPEDVAISKYYKKEETAAIENCDAFLIMLSSSSQESEEVRYEFETATEMNKKIIPIWVEDCKINDYYQQALVMFQYRMMLKPDSRIMDEIEKVIRS